jgi:hypothetical protein
MAVGGLTQRRGGGGGRTQRRQSNSTIHNTHTSSLRRNPDFKYVEAGYFVNSYLYRAEYSTTLCHVFALPGEIHE